MKQDIVYLYGTQECRLCEYAKGILNETLDLAAYRIVEVEITEDVVLLKRYRYRIPVIKLAKRQEELDWPFDRRQLTEFLC